LNIAAGGEHTVATQRAPTSGGMPRWSAYGWGANGSGQVSGATTANVTTPADFGTTIQMVAAAAGQSHTCLINGNGGTMCRGSNTFGELGVTSVPDCTGTCSRSFVTAVMPAGWYATSASANGIVGSGVTSGGEPQMSGADTCVLGSTSVSIDGQVYCFGSNSVGQWGSGPTHNVVSGLSDAVQVAVGGRHACARRTSGAVVCWGHNYYGQLGNGRSGGSYMAGTSFSNVPVAVTGITNAISITAGAEHTCAVLADGTARCWGRNDAGQLGDGTTTDRSTPTPVRR
jgi:alpha-tubulin suppressor-like RCC1 family protein